MNDLKRVAMAIAVCAATLLALSVLDSVIDIGLAAEQVHPWGFELIASLVLGLAAVPLAVLVSRLAALPRPLRPPPSDTGPEFDAYLELVHRRLRRAPESELGVVPDRAEIEAELARRDVKARELSRSAAERVFVSTAISENGTLDAYTVLLVQVQLVTQIARCYTQRPAIRELARIYAVVATSAFIAGELDEDAIEEQLEPIVGAAVGSVTGAIPGLAAFMTMVVQSMVTGAANAMLTLRVGAIASEAARGYRSWEPTHLRRHAGVIAASQLPEVLASSSSTVATAMGKAAIKLAKAGVDISAEKAREFADGLSERLANAFRSLTGRQQRLLPPGPPPEQ